MTFSEIATLVLTAIATVETLILAIIVPDTREVRRAVYRVTHRVTHRRGPCADGHLKVIQKEVPATNEVALHCDTCGAEEVQEPYGMGGTLWMRGIVLEQQRAEEIRKQEILREAFHVDELEAWRKEHQ